MENRIPVGSVVFHNNKGKYAFKGPGTVLAVNLDAMFGVDVYAVMWQSNGETWEHFRSSLLTLAEKETTNVS